MLPSRPSARKMLVAMFVVGASCTPIRFATQATLGQLDLMARAIPIDELRASSSAAPPALRSLLDEVVRIEGFAKASGLEVDGSYRSYVELEREAAVWVVTAAEPLALVAKIWSFPILGTFPYLGWFDERSAQQFASTLRADGWDVDVRGARAYSTLGWFDDPILSSMFAGSQTPHADLANIVLHEAVHATVHVNDQSLFNESLATLVGDALTRLYLARAGGEVSRQHRAYERIEAWRDRREQILLTTRSELAALYASTRSDEDKRAEKTRILAAAERQLGRTRPLNNAVLIDVGTYHQGAAPLRRLAERCGGVMGVITAVKTLRVEDFSEPQQQDLEPTLAALAARACGRVAPSSRTASGSAQD